MKHKKEKLANLIWVSHFWALYSKLPETLKEGFYSLVISIAKDIEEECKKQMINKKRQTGE